MNLVDLIADLADLFGVALSEKQFAWYVMALSDLSAEQVQRAMQAAMLQCKFLPRPAELRELAGVNAKTATDRALLAWQAVRAAISKVGYDSSVDFEDPVINATIRELGGWPAVCSTTSDEMKWLEKRFSATYSALSTCALPSEQTARLPGYSEMMNQRNGHGQHPVPVASIPSLSCTATGQIVRRLEVRGPTTKRLDGPSVPAAKLAERLSFDDRAPVEALAEPLVIRDVADQVAMLRAKFGHRKSKVVRVPTFDAERLEAEVKLAQRADEKPANEESKELRRIMSAPMSGEV